VLAGIFAAGALVFMQRGPADGNRAGNTPNPVNPSITPAPNPSGAAEPLPTKSYPPGYNFALAANGATAEGGRYPERLIDGKLDYTRGSGFAISYWEKAQPFVVKFKEQATISCIRFLLWDLSEQRFYRYKLEVCASVDTGDKPMQWTCVADKTGEAQECRSWQDITFTPQRVKQIRLTGTYNNVNSGFQVVELQAFRDPPTLEKRPAPVMTTEPPPTAGEEF
jgi:hypothetical protein